MLIWNNFMFKQLLTTFIVLCCFSSTILAMNANNPFAKNESISIGTDTNWTIDKQSKLATKTASDGKGSYYHLRFDNKRLKLSISKDAEGATAKSFSQLEIKDVQIDGKQAPLFKWCLKNQDRHDRFLQQGLTVKKNICSINGSDGTFIMRLNKETLLSLQKANSLIIMLKPFRTPVELDYDLGDFSAMQANLNMSAAPKQAKAVAVPAVMAAPKIEKKCKSNPPAEYKKIKAVEYICSDVSSKMKAETSIARQVEQEKAKQKTLADEKEKQRKLAEEKQQKELALKLEQEKLLAAEAAALAASEEKQMAINDEITQKMLNVCKKYWDKGEHRCYCEKYIEHAPSSIQASSTCK